jgi:hypothetical protein
MRRMQLSARHIFKATVLIAAMAWSCASEAEAYTPVSLLDGKLTFELEDGFVANETRITKQVIAAYKARKGDAWGAISRGRRGLPPAELGDYVARKAAEYSKGLSWLPKLTWLKQETVTINGRQWADLRFIGQLENPKGPMDGMLYTRILATSYQGELLEIVFTSNTDRNQATKTKIDRILESVKLDD